MTNFEAATFDLLNCIEDQPVTATFEGADYDGTAGGLVTRQSIEHGGFLEDYDFVWTTSLQKRIAPNSAELEDRFPGDPPAVGADLTIDDIVYRVERVTKDDYGAGLEFGLRTVNK